MVVVRDSGELESDEPIEQSFFEGLNWSYDSYSSPPTTYSPLWDPTSFPPLPPSSPLYFPAPPPPPSPSTSGPLRVRNGVALYLDFQNQQHEDVVDRTVVDLKLLLDHQIEDRGGELKVINGLDGGALNVINGLEDIYQKMTVNVNRLEHHHEDIIGQLVIDYAGVYGIVIGYRDGELHNISEETDFTINGVEYRLGQPLSTTLEPSVVIFQAKLSVKVWLGHRGQCVADIRYGWNWLNIGTFRTAEGAPLTAESVKRWRGGKDLFDYPPFLIENRSEPLQLPPTALEENQDGGIGCEGIGDCAMAAQAQFNSGCLEKRKTRKKNPRVERRNKKANGVIIEIPLDDILQAEGMRLKDAANHLKVSITKLKSSCRDYGIPRWPPRITVPSNQALTTTIDTNSVVEKEIPPPQFLPTTQQENPDAGFGNYETEAIGMGVEGTWDAVMEEAQLNSECSEKKREKEGKYPKRRER